MKLIPTLAAVYVLALIILGQYFDHWDVILWGIVVPGTTACAYRLTDLIIEEIKETNE